MKKLIGITLFLLILTSCMSTEVLHAPITKSVDTSVYKARPPKPQVDTTRVPIGFDPSVEDWEE